MLCANVAACFHSSAFAHACSILLLVYALLSPQEFGHRPCEGLLCWCLWRLTSDVTLAMSLGCCYDYHWPDSGVLSQDREFCSVRQRVQLFFTANDIRAKKEVTAFLNVVVNIT